MTRCGSTGVWSVGLGVSKLGSECLHWAGSQKWTCTNAEGHGREITSANSFVTRGVSQ